jgi:hypothetical protein
MYFALLCAELYSLLSRLKNKLRDGDSEHAFILGSLQYLLEDEWQSETTVYYLTVQCKTILLSYDMFLM